VTGGRRSITTVEPFTQLEVAVTPRLSLVPAARVAQRAVGHARHPTYARRAGARPTR
jgi:hypothetical protein